MPCTDLPTEIVRYIVEEIVLDPENGLYNALRCRLISKTFNWEVLDAIRWHEVLHPRDAPYSLWRRMSPRFVSRFLCHLSETQDQKYRYTFASFLKLFLDEWLPPRNESKYTRYELAYQLCNIAHQQAGETCYQICDVYFPFYQLPKERCEDVESHLAIAAIYLNKEEYVKDHLSLLLQPNMKSEFFGTPLHAACAVGDLSLVRSLLQSGADPNERSLLAWYPVEIAVLNNKNIDVVREILREKYIAFDHVLEDLRLYMFLCAFDYATPERLWPDNCKRWITSLRSTHNAADLRESLIPLRIHYMLSVDEVFKKDAQSTGEDYDGPPWGNQYSLSEMVHDEELMHVFLTTCGPFIIHDVS